MEPKNHPIQDKQIIFQQMFHLWVQMPFIFQWIFPMIGGVMISESFPAEVATVKVTVP